MTDHEENQRLMEAYRMQNHERYFAAREGHAINHHKIFDAGFERGWNAARNNTDTSLKKLGSVLAQAAFGSCTCMTKTPDPRYHTRICRYRFISEANEIVSDLRFPGQETPVVDKHVEKFNNIENVNNLTTEAMQRAEAQRVQQPNGSYNIKERFVAVDQSYDFMPIDENTPRGVKVQLLGQGNVAVYGVYDGNKFWKGWAPCPNIPKELK